MSQDNQQGGKRDDGNGDRVTRLSPERRRLLEALLEQEHSLSGGAAPTAGTSEPGFATGGSEPGETDAHRSEAYGREAAGQQSRILVAMKSSGRLPGFFCVHAAFGSVFPYHRLAMHLDDEQPFYGLQAPGLDGECPPLEHIDAMAELYIQAVKSVQPEGPYFLGGYSFGGWVAYEMACKLVESGDSVGLLAVFGTSVPVSVADPKIAEDADFWLDYIEHYRRLVLNSYLSDEHRMRGATFAMNDDQSTLSPLAKVVQATERAQLRYVPRPYPGMLHLYLTIEQQRAFPIDHSMGWNQLCGQKVATYLVSGNHLSMFHEPHVQDLAEQLTGSLRRVHGAA